MDGLGKQLIRIVEAYSSSDSAVETELESYLQQDISTFTMASNKGTVLIVGGTGRVGSSLAQICQASSTPYLIASRSASSATASTAHPTVKFDWLDRTTWSNPFITATKTSPITSVFLVSPPVFDSSPIINDLVDLARTEHGVRRFVMLGATTIPPGGPLYGGAGRYLHDLGGRGEVEFAYLRPTWFMDNWAEQDYLVKTIREEGRAYSAAGGGKLPWVSKTDIAAVAFWALTGEKAPNGDVTILGPENLSYSDVSAAPFPLWAVFALGVGLSCLV